MKPCLLAFIVLLLVAGSAVPVTAAGPTRSYLLISSTNQLPTDLAAQVASAGGTLTGVIPHIGVAVASSSEGDFAGRAGNIAGLRSVVPDAALNWLSPEKTVAAPTIGNPPNSGAGDFFFDLQWGATAVQAPAAWNAGYKGQGARVAVLDSGIAKDNPDLAPNLNMALSKSFVPGEEYYFTGGSAEFNHGTHVAGTIAAAMNNWGVIGIAPEAELVAVKVLSEKTGGGSFDGIMAGIVYAADIDADVINMSLGALLNRRGFADANGTWISARVLNELVVALGRATMYANQHGTTVIAAAGNNALDADHSADWIFVPAMVPGVLAISATAPIGWGADSNTNLDIPAGYTNYGNSLVSFAAPGGDSAYPGDEACTVGSITAPCAIFDLVMSYGQCDAYGCYFWWAAGTSMASAHASGVAALIIGKNGGHMAPAQVAAALRAAADDLGKPGKDPYYGLGRVNAYNAVK